MMRSIPYKTFHKFLFNQNRYISISSVYSFKTERNKPPENPRSQKQNEIIRRIPQKPIERIVHHEQNKFHFVESPLISKLDRNSIPLTILFGWASSTDKPVLKYAEIYKNFGYHTIRIAPSLSASVFQLDQANKFALQLVKMIKNDLKLDNNPIIVHAFSNVGAFIYRHVLEYANTEEYSFLRKNIKCLIHDSGPGEVAGLSYLEFVKSIANIVEKRVASRLLASTFTLFGLIVAMVKFSGKNAVDKLLQRLIEDKSNIPTLFLFSKKDYLVSHDDIKMFIHKRQVHLPSVKIDTLEFEDSEHVKHYLKYKDLYLNKLREHIKACNLPIYEDVLNQQLK